MHNQTTCNLFYIHLLCLNLYIGYSSFKYTRAYTYFTVRKNPLFHHIKTIGIRGSHSKKTFNIEWLCHFHRGRNKATKIELCKSPS